MTCKNPNCTTIYYASAYGLGNIITLAEGGSSGGYKGHRHTCTEEHVYWTIGIGKETYVSSPYSYWSCPPKTSSTCPLREYHLKKCPGTCGEYNVIKHGISANDYYLETHLVYCNEKVPRTASSLWLFSDCHGTYYSCAGVSTCTNASNHIDDDDDSTEQDTQGLQTEQTQTPSSPSMHACGVHEDWQSGDHSWITPACGDSTHAGYACQIGSSHTNLQASCTATNTSGQTCTVTSFYDCQNHTHQYPTLVPCRNRSCGQLVTNKWEHVVTCRNGHRYWSCLPSHHEYHTNRCTR